MRRVTLNIVSSIALLLTFTFVVVNPSQACSGPGSGLGAFPIDSILYSSIHNSYPTAVAVGSVDITGDSGINAVLKIDYYLAQPQEHGIVLYMQESLAYIQNTLINERPYPARCANLSPKVQRNRLFIGALYPFEGLGTYHGNIFLADEDGLFRFSLEEQPDVQQVFTMEEVIQYVEARLDTERVAPEMYEYPRPIRIQLITYDGGWYTLPVHPAMPVVIPAPKLYCTPFGVNNGCTAVIPAPNGIDRVSFYPVGSGIEAFNSIDELYTPKLEGETGVYSPDSVLFTAWTGNQLRVFATASQYALGLEQHDEMTQLATFTSPPDDPLIAGAGAWSPNGRTFAFSTKSGVWLWDALMPESQPELLLSLDDALAAGPESWTLDGRIFTFRNESGLWRWDSLIPESQPELLLSADEQSLRVRHYSPMGNYLALESDMRRYHLDVTSGQEYPDGVFSPDDRSLAAYDTAATTLTKLTMYGMPRFMPLWHISYSPQITQFEWVTPTRYMYSACGNPLTDDYSAGFEEPWCKVFIDSHDRFTSRLWVDGTAFDYEPITDSLGVVVDADTIWINGELIELSGLIEGNIMRVELTLLIDLNHTLLDG